MKRSLSLLLVLSALGSGTAANAAGQRLLLIPAFGAAPDASLTLIDADEDDEAGWLWSWSDDEDNECDDDDENDCAAGATGNAAKAGTAPPPNNGLFTNGTAPVVQSN